MASLPPHPNYLVATYQKNKSYPPHRAPSQLVHLLRDASWVPQDDGAFVRPAEAVSDRLPEGFTFHPGAPWLKAIQFGQDAAKRSAARRQELVEAEKLGFVDAESLSRAQRFTTLPLDEQDRLLAQGERRRDFELPEQESKNPARRALLVGKEAMEAPSRRFEDRTRRVPIGLDSVKDEAKIYLRGQYTNNDGEMICQVCKEATPLPFKIDDLAYFEAVQFLPDLVKRHYQNYLALCPNHAAMYQHAHGTEGTIRELFDDLEGCELEIVLAQDPVTVYFTKQHLSDMKAVVESYCDGWENSAEKSERGAAKAGR
jgi:hypothetical protein